MILTWWSQLCSIFWVDVPRNFFGVQSRLDPRLHAGLLTSSKASLVISWVSSDHVGCPCFEPFNGADSDSKKKLRTKFLQCPFFIPSLFHSFIRSFVHSFILSFFDSLILWFHSFIRSFFHSVCLILSVSFFLLFFHAVLHSFIRSFIHSFTHSLIHSIFLLIFIISFFHSGNRSCIHLFIHSTPFNPSTLHSVNHSNIHFSIPSFSPSVIHSVIPLSSHSFGTSFIHSLIHSFNQSFIHVSFIHALSLPSALDLSFIDQSNPISHVFCEGQWQIQAPAPVVLELHGAINCSVFACFQKCDRTQGTATGCNQAAQPLEGVLDSLWNFSFILFSPSFTPAENKMGIYNGI